MSLALIRAEYKTQLEAVANIGVVHDYPRLATEWKKFLDLYKDGTGKIRGWDISIASAPAGKKFISGAAPNRVEDIQWIVLIRGYFGLQDAAATAKTQDNLVEAVLAKFRPLDTLNGQALMVSEMIADPLNQERDFGGMLCHYTELRQNVWERITY